VFTGVIDNCDEPVATILKGFFGFFSLRTVRYSTLLHLPPSDSTVSEDAGIELRTVATTALAVKSSNHFARSHPQARSHPIATMLASLHLEVKIKYKKHHMSGNSNPSASQQK
jgi:hypothetical protein